MTRPRLWRACPAAEERQQVSVEPAVLLAQDEGNIHPLLTLRMRIAYHQAMTDVCR